MRGRAKGRGELILETAVSVLRSPPFLRSSKSVQDLEQTMKIGGTEKTGGRRQRFPTSVLRAPSRPPASPRSSVHVVKAVSVLRSSPFLGFSKLFKISNRQGTSEERRRPEDGESSFQGIPPRPFAPPASPRSAVQRSTLNAESRTETPTPRRRRDRRVGGRWGSGTRDRRVSSPRLAACAWSRSGGRVPRRGPSGDDRR